MAIQPQANYSVYTDCDRPFIHKFLSNNPNTVNLVYLLQIENPDTGAWETVTGHIKQPMEWGVAEFLIDPSQLCTDFVKWNIAPTLVNNLSYRGNHRIKCRMKLTEDLIDPTTGAVSYNGDETTWLTSWKFFCIDGGITHEETFKLAQHEWFEPWYLYAHNWSGGSLGTCKFLTDQPLTITECYTDNKYLSFASEYKNCWLQLTIHRQDGTVQNVAGSPVLGKTGVTQFGIGFPQIETYLTGQGTWGTYHSTSNPIVQVDYAFIDNTNTYTERYTTKFKECGCDSEYVRLWWRSNRNGIDSYTFKGTHSVKLQTSNQTFQQVLGHKRIASEDFDAATFGYHNTFTQQSSGSNKVNIVSNKSTRVISNWENGETLEWLSNIINSTNVFIEDRTAGSLKLTPVIVKSNEFQIKGLNDKLGKIELNLTYANQRTTSRI